MRRYSPQVQLLILAVLCVLEAPALTMAATAGCLDNPADSRPLVNPKDATKPGAEFISIVGDPGLAEILWALGLRSRLDLCRVDPERMRERILRTYKGDHRLTMQALDLLSAVPDVAARRSGIRNPLIFIPGIMGSRLRNPQVTKVGCGNEVWGYGLTCTVRRFDELRLPMFPGDAASALEVDGPVQDLAVLGSLYKVKGYRETLVYFQNVGRLSFNRTLFVFAYDWRRGIEEAARLLQAQVRQWRKIVDGTELNGEKFIIVGHSLGGLVARYFVEALDGHAEVARIITLGTPYKGSLIPLVAMGTGSLETFGVGKHLFDRDTVRRVAFSMASMFEMLPFELKDAVVDSATGKTLFLNRLRTWQD